MYSISVGGNGGSGGNSYSPGSGSSGGWPFSSGGKCTATNAGWAGFDCHFIYVESGCKGNVNCVWTHSSSFEEEKEEFDSGDYNYNIDEE
jgi:hypothetical protein